MTYRRPLRMRLIRVLLCIAVAVPLLPVATVAALAPCGDVQVIWARGSGVSIEGGAVDAQFQQFFNVELDPRVGPEVAISNYQLGEGTGFGGHDYPAAGSSDILFQGGVFRRFPSPFWDSVDEGKAELAAYLANRAVTCPGETFVLAGWSQGALVIGETLFNLATTVRDRIAQVALFGDPALETGNTEDVLGIPTIGWPVACWEGPEPWVRGSAPCWIGGGILGHRDPYVPADMTARIGSWCASGDGVCSGSIFEIAALALNGGIAHGAYFEEDSWAAWAAHDIAEVLKIYLPAKAASFDVSLFQFLEGATGADIAFVFDTTGSMGGEINNAKAEATNLAQEWLTNFANGRVALVEYRDHGSLFVSRVGSALTNNVSAFQTAVNALSAGQGGDIPEALNSGMMTALNELEWLDGAIKAAVVITDAPGKDPEPITGFTRDQVIQRSLEIDPVAIYGVNVGPDVNATNYLVPLAAGTAGEVLVVDEGETLADALFEVIDTVHLNPVAVLNGPYFAEPGQAILFHADGSFDADGNLVSFEWDFNGDGTADQTTTAPQVSHTYAGSFDGVAAVRAVSSDGGSSIASAEVTVDAVGLGDDQPIAVQSASAAVTGTSEVTVTWTPASNDRAEGYKVYFSDGSAAGWTASTDPNSLVVPNVDLSSPKQFVVIAVNQYGNSTGATSAPVGGAWTTQARVNDASAAVQMQPDVAIGPNGNATAVWWDKRNAPTSEDIYSSVRDAATGVWATNQRITDVNTASSSAEVAIDGNNNAYAVWSDARNGRTDIYFSKRPASTGIWSANVRVNTVTTFLGQSSPSISVTPSGAAVVTWLRNAGNKKIFVWSARLAPGATAFGPEIKVSTDGNLGKQEPRVAVAPDGTAHAVWLQPNSGNADIWYASLASGASAWSSNIKVSDDPGTAYQGMADVGVDGSGNVTVVWDDWRTSPNQLRVRRKPSGGSWPASTVIAANGANFPSLAVRSDGRAYVSWYDGSNAIFPNIWGSLYDQSTGTWSAAEQVDANGAQDGAWYAATAIDNSRVVVVFQQATRLPSGGDDNDIMSRTRAP